MAAATGRNPKVADNGRMAYSGSAKRRAWDIGRNCMDNARWMMYQATYYYCLPVLASNSKAAQTVTATVD